MIVGLLSLLLVGLVLIFLSGRDCDSKRIKSPKSQSRGFKRFGTGRWENGRWITAEIFSNINFPVIVSPPDQPPLCLEKAVFDKTVISFYLNADKEQSISFTVPIKEILRTSGTRRDLCIPGYPANKIQLYATRLRKGEIESVCLAIEFAAV